MEIEIFNRFPVQEIAKILKRIPGPIAQALHFFCKKKGIYRLDRCMLIKFTGQGTLETLRVHPVTGFTCLFCYYDRPTNLITLGKVFHHIDYVLWIYACNWLYW